MAQRRRHKKKNHGYDENSADEKYLTLPKRTRTSNANGALHDKKQFIEQDIYDRSCPIGQFFANPCLYFYLRCRKIASLLWGRKSSSGHTKNHRWTKLSSRITYVFAAAAAAVILVRKFTSSCPLDNEIGGMPVIIPAFSQSAPPLGARFFYESRGFSDGLPSFGGIDMDDADWGGLKINFPKNRDPRVIKTEKEVQTELKHYHDFHHTFQCRDVSFKSDLYPNCNNFHEIDMGQRNYGFHISYIGSGFYRNVWHVHDVSRLSKHANDYALKTLQIDKNITSVSIADVGRDALVMEKLTGSPRITNIYGYCSTSVSSEFVSQELQDEVVPGEGFTFGRHDFDLKTDSQPRNNFTSNDKLLMALQMAESIADLHGFPGGVIVHDDIQLCQWLNKSNDKDGGMTTSLVLGDFNRARIMRWNEASREYCKFFGSTAVGDYRSPEEYNSKKLDEKVDVYSFGNNIYALLTGLWPFHEAPNDTSVQDSIRKGKHPFVHQDYRTRSVAEARLTQIMEECWKFDPDERIDIFHVVEKLSDAVHELGLDTKQ